MDRPAAGAYPDYYAAYINLIAQDDMLEALAAGHRRTIEVFSTIPEDRETFRYAEGKWSVKELFGHIIDTERIMAYRALCIARGEKGSLPGFEENDYVAAAEFDNRTMMSLVEEYDHLRLANIALFRSLTNEQANRVGTANGKPISARALVAVIAGHELHHLAVLQKRYLGLAATEG